MIIMQYPWYFYKYVEPYLRNKITVSKDRLTKIHNFLNDKLCPSLITREKYKKYTPTVLYNSFFNGIFAESGLEVFMNVEFVNWEIKKPGEEDLSDLRYLDLDIGVKTVKIGNGVPLIYPGKSKFPEIITVVDIPHVYIVGYATIPVLSYYQNDNYVWGQARGDKTGFWGFHKLHEFKTLEELKNLYYNNQLNLDNSFSDSPRQFPQSEKILTWSEVI